MIKKYNISFHKYDFLLWMLYYWSIFAIYSLNTKNV